MLHVVSLARLSELECESRRLERLTLEQTLRHGELMRERTQLTDTALLLQYAAKQGMVNPVSVRPVKVGVLPPGKVHWSLPGEGQPGLLPTTGQVGQLLPLQPPDARNL